MPVHELTQWEMEELYDEIILRRGSWIGMRDKNLLVRRQEGQNQFALKFIATPDGTYTVYVRLLDTQLTQGSIERYVDWLISKFTTHTERMAREKYLHTCFPEVAVDKIRKMAIELSNPNLGDAERVNGAASHYADSVVSSPEEPEEQKAPPLPPPPRQLSKYLQKLIR